MSRRKILPSGRVSDFDEREIIVSKTNPLGHITYANDVFCRVSRYSRAETIGQPHNLIRHPDMPRCIFKLMWDTIQSGQEIFAYVLNMASNGDHYWVFAHITPTLDAAGAIAGFHSNRRKPDAAQIAKVAPIYGQLRQEEQGASDRKQGMLKAYESLMCELRARGMQYDEFAFSL